MFTNGFEKIAAINVAQAAKNLANTRAMAAKTKAGMSAMEAGGKKKSFFSNTQKGGTRPESSGSAYSRAAAIPDKPGTAQPRSASARVIKRLNEQSAPKTSKKPTEAAPKPKEKAPEGYVEKAHDWVKKNPVQSVAGGFGAGYVASKLTSDDRRQQ